MDSFRDMAAVERDVAFCQTLTGTACQYGCLLFFLISDIRQLMSVCGLIWPICCQVYVFD